MPFYTYSSACNDIDNRHALELLQRTHYSAKWVVETLKVGRKYLGSHHVNAIIIKKRKWISL